MTGPVIELNALTKVYRVPDREPGLAAALRSVFDRRWREVRAVEGLSFAVNSGELVGFLGPNGAGKTTTLKMLSGLLQPTGGSVRVLGYQPFERRPEFQRRFGLVMGHRTQLWWELPAQETLRLNKEIYELSESEYLRSLEELVELLGIGDLLSIPVKKLSLGQRMKAEFCAALLHRPRLLLLDEPTLGLDVVMQKRMRAFIKDYNKRHGATVLLTSHNMDDVAELAERVIIIDRGVLLYDGRLREVVERYAPHKLITADFREPVSPEALAAVGTFAGGSGAPGGVTHAVLEVPRREAAERAGRLLTRFPVEDLSIEETPIDEVVRRLFSSSGEGPS